MELCQPSVAATCKPYVHYQPQYTDEYVSPKARCKLWSPYWMRLCLYERSSCLLVVAHQALITRRTNAAAAECITPSVRCRARR